MPNTVPVVRRVCIGRPVAGHEKAVCAVSGFQHRGVGRLLQVLIDIACRRVGEGDCELRCLARVGIPYDRRVLHRLNDQGGKGQRRACAAHAVDCESSRAPGQHIGPVILPSSGREARPIDRHASHGKVILSRST